MHDQENIETLRKTIAHCIRTLRKASGISQERLAEAAGIGPEHLSKIETGARMPSLEALANIAAALGVPAATLLGGTDRADYSDRAGRLAVALSRLTEDDADFVESEVLTWVARLREARG